MIINSKMESYAMRLLYEPFDSKQLKAIESVCEGRDTFIVSSSRNEKKCITFVAALSTEEKPTLVIEPSIPLINEAMRNLLVQDEPVSAASLTSYNRESHDEVLKKYKKHEISILYVTADLLKKKFLKEAIKENEPWLVVVDECHLVQYGSETFRPAYLEVREFVNSMSRRPTMLAMTSIAPPADRKAIKGSLGLIEPKEIIRSVDRQNLSIIVEKWGDKEGAHLETLLYRLKKTIFKHGRGSTIVYAPTPRDVNDVVSFLRLEFPGNIAVSHGNMAKEQRAENERLFLMNACRIIVATGDVAQRIDKPDVGLIVHFGLPLSGVDFWQKIGQAGEDSFKVSYTMVLFDERLKRRNEKLINAAPKSVRMQMRKQQDEVESILIGKKCAMQGLLKILGEK